MTKANFAARAVTARKRSHGVSLIEALLAATILGFGLLAVAKFQISLSDAISAGRERVEAVMHAQDEIDRLRSFNLINNPTPGTNFGYNEVTNKTSAPMGDSSYLAAYSRGVTISENPLSITWGSVTNTPEMKLALASITWTNKSGTAQALTLPTVIAKLDPADTAWLIACQTDDAIRCGTKDVIKTPYNRSLRIPYPAKDLTGGKSAFAPPGASGKRIIFDNSTGVIEKICNDADGDLSNDVIDNLTNGAFTDCQNLNGYLISGFITAGASPRTPPNFLNIGTTTNLTDTTTIGGQTTISPAPSISSPAALVQCFDDSEAAFKQAADTISYVCIVTPHDADNNPNTPSVWSGTLIINLADTGVSVGTTSSTVKICRFGIAGSSDGSITSNRAHPANYVTVTENLENQNFILIQGNRSCAAGEIQHQP